MYILYFSVLLMLFIIGCTQQNEESTEMGNKENNEWIMLFDGSSTDHWRGYNHEEFPSHGWKVEGNELVFRPPTSNEWTSGLDIITKQTFSDFELQLEWMVSEGGNSGIFYHVLEQPTQAVYWSALEMQILDNENHPDSNMGVNGNRKAGSLYDLIPANPQNTKPHGEWNSVKIISDGNRIEHWQNEEIVVEFERFTPEWFEMLRNSKFSNHNEFGAIREGHIGLQDHGDIIKFRNIKIREL